MKKAHIFCQITKVDQTKREVTAIMTEQVTDKAGEKMHYATSKPNFQKWSTTISKATEGKSLGNVREMHQPKAAGKITKIDFLDDVMQIPITIKVVDDAAWQKCDEGVYTGVSIGGNYVGKLWPDPDEPGAMFYTVDPVEVSLVDNPCLGTAHFTSVKMDGTTVEKEFKVYVPTNEEVTAEAVIIAKAQGGEMFDHLEAARAALIARKAAVAVTGSDGVVIDDAPETLEEKAAAAKEDGLKTEGNKADEPAGIAKVEPEANAAPAEPVDWGINQVFRVEADGSVHDTKAAAKEHVKAMQILVTGASPAAKALLEAMAAAKATADKKPYGNVEYADPGYQADKKKRYPLDTAVHIRAAWSYINKTKNAGEYSAEELSHIKDAIIAAWKDKIDPAGPPSAEKMAAFGDSAVVVSKLTAYAEKAETLGLAKGLYTVSYLARIVEDFQCLVSSVGWEEEYEGDTDSMLPTQGASILHAMATYLVDMATEEVAELIANLMGRDIDIMEMLGEPDEDDAIELAATAQMIKADTALIEKAGARNSKSDQEKLQGIHDHAAAMGAKCAGSEKAAGGDLQKMMAQKEELEKVIADVLPQIKEMGETVAKVQAENADLAKQVKVLSEQPAPMPAIMPGTRVITKAQDIAGSATSELSNAEAMAELLEKFTPEQIRDMVLAKALSQPMKAEMRGAE